MPDAHAPGTVLFHAHFFVKGGERMQIEIRADGAHISGYVNVTEKKSRPVLTPRGKVVEEIEPRAFEEALARAGNIPLTRDHDPQDVLAETRAGTLRLREDAIGLYAYAVVNDERTVAEARAGKIRGWSFGMYNVRDSMEERAQDLPLRRVTGLDLDHVTLVINKTPCYSATSVEIRADTEVELETRALEDPPQVTDSGAENPADPPFDNAAYHRRLEAVSHNTEGGFV